MSRESAGQTPSPTIIPILEYVQCCRRPQIWTPVVLEAPIMGLTCPHINPNLGGFDKKTKGFMFGPPRARNILY